jgi:uncharacterized protein YbjT (DUF2867 family)
VKIGVIGGTGLVGSKRVSELLNYCHDVAVASPDTHVKPSQAIAWSRASIGASLVVEGAHLLRHADGNHGSIGVFTACRVDREPAHAASRFGLRNRRRWSLWTWDAWG